MQTSAELDKIAPALLAVHKELRVIGKDSKNPHFGNAYASLEAITENVRPILTAHDIVPIQGESPAEKGQRISTRLLHASGQWIECDVTMPLEKATAQGAGSAITYGRRYGLSAALCLSTDDDDDGHRASQQKQTKAPRRQTDAPAAGGTKAPLRSTKIDFSKAWNGRTVVDLTTDELKWATERLANRVPEQWQALFMQEYESRQDRGA